MKSTTNSELTVSAMKNVHVQIVPSRMIKMTIFALFCVLKMISRKIRVTEKFFNFHYVRGWPKSFCIQCTSKILHDIGFTLTFCEWNMIKLIKGKSFAFPIVLRLFQIALNKKVIYP